MNKILCCFVCLTFLLFPLFDGFCFASVNDDSIDGLAIESRLEQANLTIEHAYSLIIDAEEAGANVSNLLNQLNNAVEFLSKANIAYRLNDFDVASENVDKAFVLAQNIDSSALEFKEQALIDRQNCFFLTLIFCTIGAVVFICCLNLVWRRFKQRYINNIYESKPELNTQ